MSAYIVIVLFNQNPYKFNTKYSVHIIYIKYDLIKHTTAVLTESTGKSTRYFYYVTIIALRLLREDASRSFVVSILQRYNMANFTITIMYFTV